MGKGKKKKANKGKKSSGGKKVRDDKDGGDSSTVQITMSMEQIERARLAAANRTEDPLKNWTRLQNEDCPICMLPLPHGANCFMYCVTCGKTVCAGCLFSTAKAHAMDGADSKKATEKAMTCPYCRSNTVVDDDKYSLEQETKRAKAGNGESMCRVGQFYLEGMMGLLQQDKGEGLKWYRRALEAGSGNAAVSLAGCYYHGDGVAQDNDMALEYLQKSAELGYIRAFSLIGAILMIKGELEEAMLNYRKAVVCGMSDDGLFDALRKGFKDGYITKDEYAFTLRENQKACNEMKSVAREEFKEYMNRGVGGQDY